jgi:hypothetical protein
MDQFFKLPEVARLKENVTITQIHRMKTKKIPQIQKESVVGR